MKLKFLQLGNLLVFVFLLGVAFSPFAGSCEKNHTSARAEALNPLSKSDSVQGAMVVQNAFREIYKEVNPAVVRIETEQTIKMPVHPFFDDPYFRRYFGVPEQQSQKQTGLGSGFIISADGFIVTNHHVVAKVDKITVKLTNGKQYEAKLVGSDPSSDIALLKVNGAKDLKVVHIGDSDKIEVGDFAIAIGNPFGLSSTFTYGIISSKGQDVNSADGVQRIQTDAAINPGNSGGPLLNIRGEVIGINQMIYSQSGGSVGIGFAIPVNHAMEIVEKLKTGKEIKQGFIGVSVIPEPSEELIQELNLDKKTGILVGEVMYGSPAWKAGIRQYDFILEVDGVKAESFQVLKTAVLKKGPGKNIKIKKISESNRKEETVEIRIAEMPARAEEE